MRAVDSFGTAWVRVCSALVRDAVGLGEAGGGVDVEFGVGVQAVADPAHLHAAHLDDAGFGGQRQFGGRRRGAGSTPSSNRREHVAYRGAQHGQDRHGDEQPDDRVGQREARARHRRRPEATASEVKPSVRACSPSATRAAEPIRRPTRMR